MSSSPSPRRHVVTSALELVRAVLLRTDDLVEVPGKDLERVRAGEGDDRAVVPARRD